MNIRKERLKILRTIKKLNEEYELLLDAKIKLNGALDDSRINERMRLIEEKALQELKFYFDNYNSI